MLNDTEFNSISDMVEAGIMGASAAEEVQVELLWAILVELRSNRVATQQLAAQFNQVSARGTSLLMEQA